MQNALSGVGNTIQISCIEKFKRVATRKLPYCSRFGEAHETCASDVSYIWDVDMFGRNWMWQK